MWVGKPLDCAAEQTKEYLHEQTGIQKGYYDTARTYLESGPSLEDFFLAGFLFYM